MTSKKQIDPHLQNILQETADDVGAEYDQVKEVFFHIWRQTKNACQHPDLPNVLLHRFGTFSPSLRKVNSRIYSYLDQKRNGTCTDEEFNIMFPLLWRARRRIRKEKGFGQRNVDNDKDGT